MTLFYFIYLDDFIWTTFFLKKNEEEKFEFLKIIPFPKKKTSKSKSLCRHHHTYDVGARSAPAWSESQNSSIGGQFVFRAFVFVAVVVETRWCWCCSLRGFLFAPVDRRGKDTPVVREGIRASAKHHERSSVASSRVENRPGEAEVRATQTSERRWQETARRYRRRRRRRERVR